MESLYLILLAGFGGGMLRGIVGFIKYQFSYKDVKFNLPYFLFMIALSGGVGLATAWAVKGSGLDIFNLSALNPSLALIVGYAGGDFLENIYKIIVKKPSLYSD